LSTVTLPLLWASLAAIQTITALAGARVTDWMRKFTSTLFNWLKLVIGEGTPAFASSATALSIVVSIYGVGAEIH
jgi:hypothetical protein